MRIALISREYPPDTGWGGVGAYTYQTATALKEAGHDVEVIALAGAEKKDQKIAKSKPFSIEDGVTIHRVEWEEAMEELNLFLIAAPSSHFVLKSGIAIWKKFLQIHRENPFDVVEAPEHLAAGIFHAVTRLLPLVLTLHTPHSKFLAANFHSVEASFDNQFICLLERLAMVQADMLLAPSRDLSAFVAADTGLEPNQITLVRNPVNTKSFNPDGPRAIAEDGTKRIGFVGRLEERKGIQFLVQAVPMILSRHPNVEFLIIGNDTDTGPGSTSMKAFLERQLAQSGSLANVRFISHVNLADMPDYYRSADINVIPSLYDNAPYTCIEALASGNPVVVSSMGGTREYVEEGKTGHVIPGSCPKSIAEAVSALLQNESKMLSMGKEARLYALANLDIATYASTKTALYEKAIEQFKTSKKNTAIYGLPAERSLIDAVELLSAFDHMLFELLTKQSPEFRLRHTGRLLKKRPKLAMASLIVEAGKKIVGKNALPGFLQRLEKDIREKTPQPYELTRRWINLAEESEPSAKNELEKNRTVAQKIL